MRSSAKSHPLLASIWEGCWFCTYPWIHPQWVETQNIMERMPGIGWGRDVIYRSDGLPASWCSHVSSQWKRWWEGTLFNKYSRPRCVPLWKLLSTSLSVNGLTEYGNLKFRLLVYYLYNILTLISTCAKTQWHLQKLMIANIHIQDNSGISTELISTDTHMLNTAGVPTGTNINRQ